MFKDCGLSITINSNLKSVDFLDATFDFVNEICKTYCKPNNKPLYVNKHSNQPPNILKQLPKSIEKGLFETSWNIDDQLKLSFKIYNEPLNKSNFFKKH